MHSRSMLYQLHGDIGFFNTFYISPTLSYMFNLSQSIEGEGTARGGGGGVAAGCLGWSPMSGGHVGL